MDNGYSVTFTWTDEEFLALSKFILFQRSKKRKWSIAIIGICTIILTVLQIYRYISIVDDLKENVLLLQMYSMEEADMEDLLWGDCGMIFFYIKKAGPYK